MKGTPIANGRDCPVPSIYCLLDTCVTDLAQTSSDLSECIDDLNECLSPACVPTHSKEKGRRCSDDIDNDCDGDIDGADSDFL